MRARTVEGSADESVTTLRGPVTRWLRDPLVHFVVIAGLVMLAYSAFRQDEDRDAVVVSESNLLTFVQYRMRIFDEELARQRIAGLSAKDFNQLVDDYIHEEALYREAVALGLDRQDYIIKRRMVQKVEFMASDIDADAIEVSDAQARAYFDANREQFAQPPIYTFTHVFLSSEGRSRSELRFAAQEELAKLKARSAAFSDAPGHGDRFPYGVNFVEVTGEQISAQFGSAFLAGLAQLPVRKGVWQGPVASGYGDHLVMLTGKQDGGVPDFEEVRDKARIAAARALAERENRTAVNSIIAQHPVVIKLQDTRLSRK